MSKMTTHERITRMFEHKEADRVPILVGPWGDTIERWHREGLPKGTSYVDYFDIDKRESMTINNSFRFEEKIVEETDRYTISTTEWGATLRRWKHATSVPEFLDFKIKDSQAWLEHRSKIDDSADRINWNLLKNNYDTWKGEGRWLEFRLAFGFDYTHSWIVGTETILIALLEEPEWCTDMFHHLLDNGIKLMDRVLDAGYKFDSLFWWDDMGYKNNQFFSMNIYRDLLKPVHKKAIEWAHSRGLKAHLHSCGDVNPFVPELVEMGLDCLNPLEVKAGMDPIELKKKFGDRLVLNGGINSVLLDSFDEIEPEIRRILPAVMESGGFIFSSDHSIPSSVDFETFGKIIGLVKEIGSYK
jgi:uroporphyrinogen decarboxylase